MYDYKSIVKGKSMKEYKKITIVLELEVSSDLEEILDKVAGRVYTMSGIENVTATYLEPKSDI